MKRPRICVVGSLNMDLVIQTPELPVPGQTVLGGPFATHPGGKGANQAVAAARLGAAVAMVGCVGADAFGDALRSGLVAEGIETESVLTRDGIASGVALIAVDPRGRNTIIVAPGANATVTVGDVRAAAGHIESADVLLLQLEVPLAVVSEAASIARSAGALVILNPAPAQPLPPDLLAHCDYLVPNELEAEVLSGIRPADWETGFEAAEALRGLGARAVVITLGERGALLLDEDGVARQPAFPVTAIDTTAAGDAFVGAFAASIACGHPSRLALRRAAAAGALACTVPGAQPSLPRAEAVDELLSSADDRTL